MSLSFSPLEPWGAPLGCWLLVFFSFFLAWPDFKVFFSRFLPHFSQQWPVGDWKFEALLPQRRPDSRMCTLVFLICSVRVGGSIVSLVTCMLHALCFRALTGARCDYVVLQVSVWTFCLFFFLSLVSKGTGTLVCSYQMVGCYFKTLACLDESSVCAYMSVCMCVCLCMSACFNMFMYVCIVCML